MTWWEVLRAAALFSNSDLEVQSGVVRFRRGWIRPDPRFPGLMVREFPDERHLAGLEDRILAPARRRLRDERLLRERFGTPEALFRRRFRIPDGTEVSTLGDLAVALRRAAGAEVLRVSPELSSLACRSELREGTVEAIAAAAAQSGSGLSIVRTECGAAVVPREREAAVREEEAAVRALRERLETVAPGKLPPAAPLPWLAARLSDVAGVPVWVERSLRRIEVASPDAATAAVALDGVARAASGIGWTIVGNAVLVLRAAPGVER